MADIDELRWIRIFDPIHIPKALIDNIRSHEYDSDEFVRYHKQTLLVQTPDGVVLNPLSHVYILANKQDLVKGFVWMEIDPLTGNLCIQEYSVDKEYWNKGYALGKLVDHALNLRDELGIKHVFLTTNYPKHAEKYGFKRNKNVLMKYQGGE